MAQTGLPAVLHYLRRLGPSPGAGALEDAELVERYVQSRDRAAFETLVRRHAALVWNVCRRVLQDEHHAEDAFQAVFLTMVRKIHTVGRRASIASWLYKVAYRLSLEAKQRALRRKRAEEQTMPVRRTEPSGDLLWRDLRPVLDEEISRLPEKYRAAVILCYLEEKTNQEAARQLGCPVGTVVTRLAWARRRLRSRLASRGITLSVGSLAAALCQQTTASAVPLSLLDATVQASLLLAAGQITGTGAATAQALMLSRVAMQSFLLSRLKLATLVCVCLAVSGSGASLLGRQFLAVDPQQPRPGKDQATAPRPKEPEAPAPAAIAMPATTKGKTAPEEQTQETPEASRKEIRGFLQSIDLAKRSLSLRGDDGVTFEDRIVIVRPGASIAINEKEAKLSDLKPGCKVILTLSGDQTAVMAIRAKDQNSGRPDGAPRAPSLRGTLKAIDGHASMTVSVGRDGKRQDRTLALTDSVRVEIGTTTATLQDLKPGMAVWLKLTQDGRGVDQIKAERLTP